jgi:large subunit ribosomal protein L10
MRRRAIELNRTAKTAVIDRLRTELADVPAIVVTDFKGLDVASVDELRSQMRKANITYSVVKNTLVRAALSGTEKENLAPLFKGNSAIAFHREDPAAPAKLLLEFGKTHEQLVLKGAWLDGNILDVEGVKILSKLPGKDELRAMLLRLFKAAPTTFVRTLVEAPTGFVRVLRAREQQLAE